MERKDIPVKPLLTYCVIFYGFWTIWEFLLSPSMTARLDDPWLSNICGDVLVKNLIWTLPAFWLMGKYGDSLYISRREMLTMKPEDLKWMLWIPVFFAYAAVYPLLETGRIGIAADFHPSDFIWLAVVGITEESVFRGWLLNATLRENNKWKAILLNALAFLAIHFPIWIHNGMFVSAFASLGFMSVVLVSILFSWSFVKTRSIAVPVVLHVVYDLILTVIA